MRRLFSRAAALVLMVLTAATAWAQGVDYIDADGNPQNTATDGIDGNDTPTEINESNKPTTLTAGWYVVTGNVHYNETVNLDGDVHLILADGKTMNIGSSGSRIEDRGIDGASASTSLTIYGQILGTGALNVYTDGFDNNNHAIIAGNLTINGGTVTADVANGVAGVSVRALSTFSLTGSIIINGGTVTANSSGLEDSYGIFVFYGNLVINGGIVTASGNTCGICTYGNITLGWTNKTDRITVNSYYGSVSIAANKKLYGSNGNFYSSGSDLSAIGGVTLRPAIYADYLDADGNIAHADAIVLDSNDHSLAAGNYIVNGTTHYTSGITFNGDVNLILADGSQMSIGTSESRINGSGIYKEQYSYPSLTIYGQSTGDDMGTLSIYTTGGSKYGIHANALTINGGHITVNTEGNYTIALGSVYEVTINGGTVSATATGNGAHALHTSMGFYYNGGDVTVSSTPEAAIYARLYNFNWRNPTDRITIGTTGLYALNDDLNGSPFYDKYATFSKLFTDGNGNYYGGTISGGDFSSLAGKTLIGTENVSLANDESNTDVLTAANGMTGLDVKLDGRTLYKDGDWNTLCLPFNATKTGPLDRAVIKELDTETVYNGHKTGMEGGTLYLNFKDAESIVAGRPYLVKWDRITINSEADWLSFAQRVEAGDIVNPVFGGVTIDASAPTAVVSEDGKVTFVGNYDPFAITDSNINDIIYLGANNTIGYASAARTLRSCRAHFVVSTSSGNRAMTRAVMNFGGEDGTITLVLTPDDTDFTNADEVWYLLDGRRLEGEPTQKGMYINGGRKVVIK